MTEEALAELQQQYANLKNKYDLVAAVLGSQIVENNTTRQLDLFHSILTKDFIEDFSAKEDTMTADATALSKLQSVEKELREVVKFPMLSTKNIIAVAGSFSSGKSKFLNTVIRGGGIHLSVGINPVTAIPTFVLMGKQPTITAYTPDGRQGQVSVDLFNKIDHHFIDSLGFNLKNIMPYVTVTSPFTEKLSGLNNICIIDTPGYDPAANESTEEDRMVTYDILEFASSIMWFVDIDNGTIHKNDIQFLQDVCKERPKKIYIVISKADKKKSSIQSVMERVKSDLEDNDIIIEGISAFSSNENREYMDEELQTSLYDFLSQQNENVIDTAKRIRDLTGKIDQVFQMYHDSIAQNTEDLSERIEYIKKMQINYEKSIDSRDRKISELEDQTGNTYRERRRKADWATEEDIISERRSSDFGSSLVKMRWGLLGSVFSRSMYQESEEETVSVEENHSIESDTEDGDVDFLELIIKDKSRLKANEANDRQAYQICLSLKKCVENIFAELNPKSVEQSKYKRFCSRCGSKLTMNQKFCGKCGESTAVDSH